MGQQLSPSMESNKLVRRITAFIADIMVISIPMSIITAVIFSFCEPNAMIAAICAAVCTAALLCKELFKPSIGKRLMKMDIAGKDGSSPTAKKLIIRNLTFGLWFIELIIVSFSKEQARLTDKPLGLEVIYY